MREKTSVAKLVALMDYLGTRARRATAIYFTGGATAVWYGWRETTIDVDLKIVPERDEVFRLLPEAKELLKMNIELASPADFLPELPGWESRSPFIAQQGKMSFYHYDPYAQVLAKIERGHAQDQEDVASFFRAKLVEADRLLECLETAKQGLYRYPAVDPAGFDQAVRETVRTLRS